MASRRAGVWAAVAAGLLAAGCGGVNRRFVIESNIPNAQVYIDDKWVGAAPAHAPFEYYGYFTVRLVHPDHETLVRRVHVVAPWYAYPPFDFLAEVIWPFRIDDVRRYHFNMDPLRRPDPGELIQSADALRARGMSLPQAEHPAANDPGPRVLPAPAPLPDTAPAPVPQPGPAAAPAPQPGPAVAPPPGPVIPRVTP